MLLSIPLAPGVVSPSAYSEAAAPDILKPSSEESAVPEASTLTLESQTNTEIMAFSAKEAIPPPAESVQSNGDVATLVSEEQAVTQAVFEEFATANEDSKGPEAPVEETVVQGQPDLDEGLKESLVQHLAQVPEVVTTTQDQAVTGIDPPKGPAAEESVLAGDVVDGLPVFQEGITDPHVAKPLSESVKCESLEATIESVKEEPNEAATRMEVDLVDLTVDVATQNEVVAEKEAVVLSEAVQAKVQANRAGPSLPSQHLSGGFICVKSDPLLVLLEKNPFTVLCMLHLIPRLKIHGLLYSHSESLN